MCVSELEAITALDTMFQSVPTPNSKFTTRLVHVQSFDLITGSCRGLKHHCISSQLTKLNIKKRKHKSYSITGIDIGGRRVLQ